MGPAHPIVGQGPTPPGHSPLPALALRRVPASLTGVLECPSSMWTQVGPRCHGHPRLPRSGSGLRLHVTNRPLASFLRLCCAHGLLFWGHRPCSMQCASRIQEAAQGRGGGVSCIGPWAAAAPELPPRSPNQRGSARPKLHSPPKATQPEAGFVSSVRHSSLPAAELCLPQNATIHRSRRL